MNDYNSNILEKQNDKAIEFQSIYNNTKRHLNDLKKIGINCDVYFNTLEQIRLSTEEDALKTYNKVSKEIEGTIASSGNNNYIRTRSTKMLDATISLAYQEGIDKINSEVEEELKKYDIYLKCHYYCEKLKIELKMDQDIPIDKVKEYAENILDILTKINLSGTRIYSFEEEVVESIYDIAYDVIKLEMFYLGRSTILDYAKNNLIASSFLSERIENDIERKSNNGKISDRLQAIIYDARSNGNILDDRIVFSLSIVSKDNFKNIESRLIDLTRKLNELKIAYNELTTSKDRKEYSANVYKESIYYGNIAIKRLIKNILGISLVGSILATGLGMLAKKNSETLYKTNVEVLYSSSDVIQTKAREYERLDNPEAVRIYEYGVWEDTEVLFKSLFKRKVTWYDVSSVEADSVDDYLSSNLEDYEHHIDYQRSLIPELYKEAIIEVVKLIQNQDEPVFVSNFLGFAATVLALSTLFGVAYLDKKNILTLIQEVKDKKIHKENYQKQLLELEEILESSRRFMAEHKEYEEEFERLYSFYKLSGRKTNDDIEEMHLKLTKKK